ncbi:gamma-interferon-inducible lysosomal thiol reductase-like isoform X2 [Macrobrachium rosenbergii]|uniref:gamma-interferon-inducible lysosomal thiol reductase-like isoform X2 n=1 Tax=Macrobrachium rosenbergii TaxID=79674 RepID=UPI0034D60FF8
MDAKAAAQTVMILLLSASIVWPVLTYIIAKMTGAEPVKVSLYDETYCPACRQFVKEQLGPTWRELNGIMAVELVAYGWAEETPLRLVTTSPVNTDLMNAPGT